MDVVIFTGKALADFVAMMGQLPDAAESCNASNLRVGMDEEGVKFSLNGGVWSPGMGERQ